MQPRQRSQAEFRIQIPERLTLWNKTPLSQINFDRPRRRRNGMKPVQLVKVVGSILAVAAVCHAYGQTSDAGATTSEPQAAAPSAKSIRVANRQLSRKVSQAISKAGIPTSKISVIAKQGKVTLTGSVPDPAQVAQAGEVAKNVAGVVSVEDKLTVGFKGQ
jgi:osmotically-inducible protein OsmY